MYRERDYRMNGIVYVWSENDRVRAQFFYSGHRMKMMFLGSLDEDKKEINSRINFWKQSGYEV